MATPLTRAEAIERLKAHAARRGAVTARWLLQHDRATYHGLLAHFESIAQARVEARIPGPPRRRTKWSRTRVLDALQRLARRRRLRLTATSLNRAGYSGLVRAACVYVGSLPRARRLAGIPDPVLRGSRRELWDDDRVIHEIRQRHRSNLPLAVSKAPTKLVAAAQTHCGGWRAAIEMAGLDYDTIRLNRAALRKDEVLAALRASTKHNRRGVGPDGIGGVLARQARRLFGDVRSAAVVAGLDPEAVLRRLPWTRSELEAELRRLAREQPAMTISELRQTKIGTTAAKRYGGLPAALDRLGIRGWPRRVREPLPSREDVLRELHARRRGGASMRQQDLIGDQPRLWRAARKHFGSLRDALRAAGLRVPGDERWSQRSVLDEIESRRRNGIALVASRVPPRLRRAAIEHFGSWADAVKQARREDPASRRQRTPWSNARVIEVLRASARSGRTGVGAGKFATGAVTVQAHRRFGSLRAAILAAGLDPARVLRRQHRTNREIAAELRKLAQAKPGMTITQLHHTDLGAIAASRYGTLAAALEALGIRGWPRRVWEPLPSRDETLRDLQRRHERGAAMRQSAVADSERRLLKAAVKHFGTWRAAMHAAGLGGLVGGGQRTWRRRG